MQQNRNVNELMWKIAISTARKLFSNYFLCAARSPLKGI